METAELVIAPSFAAIKVDGRTTHRVCAYRIDPDVVRTIRETGNVPPMREGEPLAWRATERGVLVGEGWTEDHALAWIRAQALATALAGGTR